MINIPVYSFCKYRMSFLIFDVKPMMNIIHIHRPVLNITAPQIAHCLASIPKGV